MRSVQLDGLLVGRGELLVAPDARLPTDAIADLDHHLGVVGEELLGVLPALAELLTLVGVPGTRLLHDAEIDRDVEQGPLTADALAVHDVELALAERRGALCFAHLLSRAAAAEPP